MEQIQEYGGFMSIKIKGVIGYDVLGGEFADRISRLDGDIEFEIDSPGGSVFHGISIYNAIKNYNKGKCTMHVVGDASSMAAYIMLAGDGPVIFEPNAVSVIHNPWTIAAGDYNEFKKQADILERLAALYAKAFVEKGLFDEKEIRQIMDAETWFIGKNELKKLGKVIGDDDEKDNNGQEEDKTIAIEAARLRMKEAQAKIKQLELPEESSSQIAALMSQTNIPGISPLINLKAGKKTEITAVKTKEGEKQMVATLSELKAEKPAIYTEAKNEGIEAERKRVSALMKFIDVDKQAVIDAVANGTRIGDDDFQAAILAARVKADTIRAMEDENPGDIDPKEETHAPEGDNPGNTEKQEEEKEKQKQEAETKQLEDIVARMNLDDID